MTEVDLPRGGSIVEKKEKRQRKDPEDDGLFKKKAKKDDEKKGKVDLPEGHESSGKENELDGVWKNPITQEVMVDGVLGLGYVAEIRTFNVILETASSFRVTLPITELGPYGLAEMKADRLQLEEAFPIGHALPFKVLAKEKIVKKKPLNKPAPTESSAVKVSIDPAKINKHLGPTTIFIGLAVAAEVKSIEEKGLLLDVGLKNTSAFLSNDLLPNGFTAKVGLPLTVRIQSTSNMRMLQVALAVEMDTLSQEAVSSLSLRSIMPGTIILATPLQTKNEGAYVSLGNGINAWLPRRAMPPRIRANINSFVKPLRVVILLCQQNSRLLCVSAHPDIVAVSRPEKRRNFEGVRLGDVLKCEITRFSGGKVEMSIVKDEEDDGKGSLVIVTATKATLDAAGNEKRYAVGSQHEMRVLGLKIAERTINVGNTKEIMKQPMVSFHDAKGGAKVSAVIKQITTAGVHVLIFNRIRGFIPIRYMCDKPLANVMKDFPINESIPCRVLTSSEEHRNILLTARKSQVSDKGSLITDFSSVQPGQTCVGVVVHQFPRGGSLVSFYNDIRGMLSDVECRKKKNLKVGDALNVRVVSVDEERKRLELAVADGSLPANVVVKEKIEEDYDEKPSVTHVKKFGIYKARVEGLVELPKDAKKAAAERARCALLLKFSGGVLGRLHVSELPSRFLVEGSNPMESFLSEYQHRSVHVLVMTLKHVVVDERKLIICDVTLNEEKLANVKKSKKTVDFRNKFHIGDILPVYYSAHGLKKGQVVYEVNPRWRALVEGTTDKNTVNPDCGVMKSAKVLAINKQSQELTVVLTDKMKLQPGSLCTARFHSAALHPIKTQVTVSSGEIGLLTLTSICDDFEKAVKKMKEMKSNPNELMDVRLLAHHPHAKTYQWIVVTKERSAKKNGVTDPLIKSRDDVTEGSTLRGFVAYIKKDEIKIEIGPGVLAELMEESEQRESLKVNDLVSLRVVEVDEDGDIYVEVEEIVQNNHSNGERKRLSSTATDSESPKKRGKAEKGEKEERKREEKQKKELVDPGFDWSSSAFSMDAMAEIGGIGGKMSGLKVDSEKEGEMEVDGEEKKTVKKEKKKKSEMSVAELEVEKEKKLSAQERRMMDKEAELTSDADYARVLKGNPNEAQMWIEYMSHFIKKDELAKARATAEKALTTINYREDAQLFILWCAYLNLEVVFGDSESWNGVFTRACESADSFKMHKHMAATLAQNDKFTEADAVYEKLIKKFRAQSDEVWTLNAEYLYSNGREEEARALMTRALQCVPKTKHVALISRFAALEYTKGDQEKGRNLFENLLATYPKKTEVWSTYVDLSVKYASVDQTRHVLERVTSLPLSVFKLRQFYKKWIDLETKEGDENSLAEVKKKALQYVTSLKEILDE